MSKPCTVASCERVGTLSSPTRKYYYCTEHATCSRCGRTVDTFVVHPFDLPIVYVCMCVAQVALAHKKQQENKEMQQGSLLA